MENGQLYEGEFVDIMWTGDRTGMSNWLWFGTFFCTTTMIILELWELHCRPTIWSGWWLSLSLRKIWKPIWMMTFPIYGKIKNLPNHQQSDICVVVCMCVWTWRMTSHQNKEKYDWLINLGVCYFPNPDGDSRNKGWRSKHLDIRDFMGVVPTKIGTSATNNGHCTERRCTTKPGELTSGTRRLWPRYMIK